MKGRKRILQFQNLILHGKAEEYSLLPVPSRENGTKRSQATLVSDGRSDQSRLATESADSVNGMFKSDIQTKA
jgi:hypothetical protein